MLLEIGKSNAVTHLFRKVSKGFVFSRRHYFSQSVKCCVVGEKGGIQRLKPIKKTINLSKDLKCFFSSQLPGESVRSIDKLTFESVCTETLESLSEYFEELVETVPGLKNADVIYSDGVLTVNFGKAHGTYVINRQTPNLQIWLSSPTSGPKRYDYIDGTWVYKHDKTTLHSLLDKEIKEIANQEVQFVEKCLHSKTLKNYIKK